MTTNPTAHDLDELEPHELDAWLIQHVPLLRDAYVAYVVDRAAESPRQGECGRHGAARLSEPAQRETPALSAPQETD